MFLEAGEEGWGTLSCLWGMDHLLCIQASLTHPKSTVGKEATPLCFLPSSPVPLDLINVYQVHIIPINSHI